VRPGETPNDDTQRRLRRLKAADLRADGKTYREIATLLKVDLHTAWDDVAHMWGEKQRLKGEVLEAARARDVAILERCIAGLADLAEAGDAPAATAIRGLVAEKAKILGEYAPTKTETKDTTDEVAKMSPAEKLEAHRKAIAELEQEMAGSKGEVH
jgi:hypothetical protein